MQVSFNPINAYNANFKGSFTIQDLEALIADFDIDDEVDEKPVEKTQQELPKMKSIAKNFNVLSDGDITKVKMWSSAQWSIGQHISSLPKQICLKQRVHPTDDLFAVQGLTEDDKRYVLFNTFYKDENTGVPSTQLFYLESEDDNYTQLQKNVFKILRDPRNKGYLTSSARFNPFAKFSHGAAGSTEFAPVVNAMAEVSKEAQQNDMINEKGEFRPIIYTADGQYVRYKHFTAPFQKIV